MGKKKLYQKLGENENESKKTHRRRHKHMIDLVTKLYSNNQN